MANQNDERKPTLAILGGTGKEGPGLALRWAVAGYPIVIGSRMREKAEATALELNEKLGISSIRGLENADAARAADICVLTVVYSAHESAVEGLRDALQGKIVIDATARVDFRAPIPPAPPAAAQHAQRTLGEGARVVAAFQNVPAHTLAKELGESLDLDVLVCADDQEAAGIVMKMAEDAGMRAYYAGGLANAVVVEGITSLLISINRYYGKKTASIKISGI